MNVFSLLDAHSHDIENVVRVYVTPGNAACQSPIVQLPLNAT
jgi:hypothetical protein